jgi:hypothetical protein
VRWGRRRRPIDIVGRIDGSTGVIVVTPSGAGLVEELVTKGVDR